jgi:hypothetical protein
MSHKGSFPRGSRAETTARAIQSDWEANDENADTGPIVGLKGLAARDRRRHFTAQALGAVLPEELDLLDNPELAALRGADSALIAADVYTPRSVSEANGHFIEPVSAEKAERAARRKASLLSGASMQAFPPKPSDAKDDEAFGRAARNQHVLRKAAALGDMEAEVDGYDHDGL